MKNFYPQNPMTMKDFKKNSRITLMPSVIQLWLRRYLV